MNFRSACRGYWSGGILVRVAAIGFNRFGARIGVELGLGLQLSL